MTAPTPDPRRQDYDRIALAIGETCILWGLLEVLVHDIVLHLAVYLDDSFDHDRTWHVLHIALTNMELREKIATAKALAHGVTTPDSPDLYDRTETLLNHMDNVLRSERNRYVHDYWQHDGEEIVRLKQGTRVIRPQSRQTALYLWTARRYEGVEAIRGLVTNLEFTQLDLIDLDGHIAWLVGQKEQPGSHRQPLPPEWRSLAHRDWREPNTRPSQP